jgi:hypothetical protein
MIADQIMNRNMEAECSIEDSLSKEIYAQHIIKIFNVD